MKVLIIAVVAVVALGGGGYGGYTMGYSGGEEAGYEGGYSAGQEIAYSQGHDEGYEKGNTEGYTEGYDEGKDEGYTEGHDKGYLSGKQEGYTDGYASGTVDGYQDGVEAGLGHGYTIKDPTYAEVIAFLERDTTDSNEYIEGIYECQHFVRDICDNAEAEGFRCAYVGLRYPAQGHAIVAFNTVDRGLVYFEPQFDAGVEPVTGKRFRECVILEEGVEYIPPPGDDTIIDIVIIW